MLLMLVPLSVTLTVFHELIYVPRLLDCQQNVPEPSKVKGAVIVDVIGLHVPTLPVGVMDGVRVRVGVAGSGVTLRVVVIDGVTVTVPLVGVKVRVAVRVGVKVGPTAVRVGVKGNGVTLRVVVMDGVEVRVGVNAVDVGVKVRVKVLVITGVSVGVLVGPTVPPGSTPQTRVPL